MAVHTVPQDVETDDKILGPFNLRQFLYLIAVVALCGIAYLLAKIFIALIIIPVPFIIFLLILALPLKKDQPMETYLAAKISFLFKNNKRIWMPGQSETTILITAPKKVEENRTKNLSRNEVARRLSFLADIVDTEGYAIKGTNPNLPFNQEVYAEAEAITDMYDTADKNEAIDNTFEENNYINRQNAIEQMRIANGGSNYTNQAPSTVSSAPTVTPDPVMPSPMNAPMSAQDMGYQVPALPDAPDYYDAPQTYTNPQAYNEPQSYSEPVAANPAPSVENFALDQQTPIAQPAPEVPIEPNEGLVNLANNTDYTVETIAKEANRITEKQKPDDEVYISLH